MSTGDLLEPLRELLQGPDAAEGVAKVVARLCAEAEARWPGLAVAPIDFVAHIARHIPRDEPLLKTLGRLHSNDLYLAYACAIGDARAVAAFLDEHGDDITGQLSRMRLAPPERSDLAQELRIRILVPNAGRTPLIAEFAGRGTLRGWVRAIVVHAALKAKRKLGAEQMGPARAESVPLSGLVAASRGPEIALFKATYGAAFERAFAMAMQALDSAERTLLRQRFLDGLTIDELAPIYRLHRATVARRLVHARAHVLGETRRYLVEREGVAPGDITSVLRFIRSEIDMSISRHLADATDPTAGPNPR